MKRIVFEYKDAYSHGNWNRQECVARDIAEAISFYGLDQDDVKWRLISCEPA